jgi:hypothetical protein
LAGNKAAVSLPPVEDRNVAKLTRTARAAVVALALALVVAAPAAAGQPARTVTHLTGPRVGHFAAGDGCTFDVTVHVSSRAHTITTEFSDGRTVYQGHAMKRAITSDVTGKTFVENQQFRDVEWIDPESGLLRGNTSGQFIDTFWPGDVGPYGIVDAVVSYAIIGSQTYTLDPTTFATLDLTVRGTITDICAAIS